MIFIVNLMEYKLWGFIFWLKEIIVERFIFMVILKFLGNVELFDFI